MGTTLLCCTNRHLLRLSNYFQCPGSPSGDQQTGMLAPASTQWPALRHVRLWKGLEPKAGLLDDILNAGLHTPALTSTCQSCSSSCCQAINCCTRGCLPCTGCTTMCGQMSRALQSGLQDPAPAVAHDSANQLAKLGAKEVSRKPLTYGVELLAHHGLLQHACSLAPCKHSLWQSGGCLDWCQALASLGCPCSAGSGAHSCPAGHTGTRATSH